MQVKSRSEPDMAAVSVADAPAAGRDATTASASKGTWLFVLPWEPHHVGGVNQVVLSLATELRARGTFVPLIGVERWGQRRPEYRAQREQGVDVLHLWSRTPLVPTRPWRSIMAWLFTLPATLLRLAVALHRHDVDVVNVHYPSCGALNWILLRKLGLFPGRVVLSLHGLDVRSEYSARGLSRWLWQRTLDGADHVVACSDGLGEETIRAFQLRSDVVTTVHNGIDEAIISAKIGRAATGALPTSRRYLVNIGTFEHKKGHDILLTAYASIAHRHEDLDLVIIGRDGATLPELRATIADLGLAHRVHLLRNLPHGETLHILRHAELFVLASRNEGFAMALLEAAALGRPIIATDVCGVDELIEHGTSGLIVHADDSPGLASAIESLLTDIPRARAMGTRIQRLVEERFNWRDKCAEYVALVQGRRG